MTGLPIASSTARCAAKTAASPPASTVISAVAALWTPPVTGHSSVATPRAAASSASRSSSRGSFVLMSIQVPPGGSPSSRPSGPETTLLIAPGDGRHVITHFETRATDRGEVPARAPAATRRPIASASRS